MESIWPTVKDVADKYVAHTQHLRNYVEKQTSKMVLRTNIYEDCRHSNGCNESRCFQKDALGRSGFMSSSTVTNLQVIGVHSRFQEDVITPRWKFGDYLCQDSGSGKKLALLNRTQKALRENICTMCTTSYPGRTLGDMIRDQIEGVKDCDLEEWSLKGYVKSTEQKEAFRKKYPLIQDTEELVIEIPGREETERVLGGSFYELSLRIFDDISVIGSQNLWKGKIKKEDLSHEFESLACEYSEAFRKSFPVIMSQRDKIENMIERISNSKLVVNHTSGENTSYAGLAFTMRLGAHGDFNKPDRKIVHLDSKNKPRIKAEIEALSEDDRRNYVTGIAFSESFSSKTDTKANSEWMLKLGCPVYFITPNTTDETLKANKDRVIETPIFYKHVLRENPLYTISTYPVTALEIADGMSAVIMKASKSTVEETHKED